MTVDYEWKDKRITYHITHAPRFQYALDVIRGLIKPDSFIGDIGCHRLDFAAVLRHAGYRVVGFDVPEFISKV